jgi:hypothetical protein
MKITITESPDGPYEPTGWLDTEIETAKGKLSGFEELGIRGLNV